MFCSGDYLLSPSEGVEVWDGFKSGLGTRLKRRNERRRVSRGRHTFSAKNDM